MLTFENILELFQEYLLCDPEEEVLSCKRGYVRLTWNKDSRYCVMASSAGPRRNCLTSSSTLFTQPKAAAASPRTKPAASILTVALIH